MSTKLRSLFIVLALFAGVHQAAAQVARFFRISGPAATTITAFRTDGTLVWSNALGGTNYTVQTATRLGGGVNWVDYVQLPITNAVNTNLLIAFNAPSGMALIPAGSFTMGNCMDQNEGDTDELPLHTVYVSAFYMDKFDVILALWQQVYNWAVNHGYRFDYAGSGKAANHPVQTIDWYDCVKWCNARSEMEGRTPAYYTSAALAVVYRTGELDISNACVNWGAGYRLPTEAEWEKAARGGLSGQRFPWGDTISESQANYYSYWPGGVPYPYDVNSYSGLNALFNTGGLPYTSPVNYFAPNGYGLYDMAGNVFQWCWDWYEDYSSGSQTDPRGPTTGQYGSDRVFRGGSWDNEAFFCRSANRIYLVPADYDYDISFRSVLPSGQ
ncbi:MAG TPA: formylglycine-generating enzyme family protein [Verrucomicrobiae bacterium]